MVVVFSLTSGHLMFRSSYLRHCVSGNIKNTCDSLSSPHAWSSSAPLCTLPRSF